MKRKIDGIILATFICGVFYSATYPYIHKIVVSAVSDNWLAINQIINCISIIIFGSLWNKASEKIFKFYPILCMTEVILNVGLATLISFNHNIALYYILDTVIFATITRNICCGYNKLVAIRYNNETVREQFGNNVNSASALSTIIGSCIAMAINLDNIIIMIWIAVLGNCVDNFFYIAIYHSTLKKRRMENDKTRT